MAELMTLTSLRELFTESTQSPHLSYVFYLNHVLSNLSYFISSIDRFVKSLLESNCFVFCYPATMFPTEYS